VPDRAAPDHALRILPRLPRGRREPLGGHGSLHLIERHARVYKHTWTVLISGVFEPLFYLLSIGKGLGTLVGGIHGVTYTQYVAPALLATSAMNGAIYDATANLFFKLKYQKLYDAVLATPLSVGDVAFAEVLWALTRGAVYSFVFVAIMAALGLVVSWWALLALPVAIGIGFAFAATGMAAVTWCRSWQDLELMQIVILPLFLFSATFYPLGTYPHWLQVATQVSPLYHGVALERSLTLGDVGLPDIAHGAVLVALGAVAMSVATRRLGKLLVT
jgi:lipooligosaccharide transport system permease protein